MIYIVICSGLSEYITFVTNGQFFCKESCKNKYNIFAGFSKTDHTKNSKMFMKFEVTNFKKFLKTVFTRKLSQKNFEVDNFIFSEKIQFFSIFFSSFWAIPLFF